MSPENLTGGVEQEPTLEQVIAKLNSYLELNQSQDVYHKDEFVDHLARSGVVYWWAKAIQLMGEPEEPGAPAEEIQLEDLFIKRRQPRSLAHHFEAKLSPDLAHITANAEYHRIPYLHIVCPITPELELDKSRVISTTFRKFDDRKSTLSASVTFGPSRPREAIPRGEAGVGLRATRKFTELLIESAEKTLAAQAAQPATTDQLD